MLRTLHSARRTRNDRILFAYMGVGITHKGGMRCNTVCERVPVATPRVPCVTLPPRCTCPTPTLYTASRFIAIRWNFEQQIDTFKLFFQSLFTSQSFPLRIFAFFCYFNTTSTSFQVNLRILILESSTKYGINDVSCENVTVQFKYNYEVLIEKRKKKI